MKSKERTGVVRIFAQLQHRAAQLGDFLSDQEYNNGDTNTKLTRSKSVSDEDSLILPGGIKHGIQI